MRDALFLILDAVPFQVVQRLHERGALHGFGRPRPMVAPFPSLTNVGVPALLSSFVDGRPKSYEPRWYHAPSGEVRGGVTTPEAEEVLSSFQGAPKTPIGQMGVYLLSSHMAYLEIRWYARSFAASHGAWLGWVNATDAVGHFEGEEALLLAVGDIMGSVRKVARELGDPLVVLCSDHGMAFSELSHLDSLQLDLALRHADVGPFVLVPHGDVAAGVVHCAPERAGDTAAAVARIRGIDLGIAAVAPDAAEVHSGHGVASIRFRPGATRTEGDDVLGLGSLRGDWVDDRTLLQATWDGPYPYAPVRIRAALDGTLVQWPAPVLFSMAAGWTYGPPLTHVAARLRGGQIGTHGALLREQTLGFALSNEDAWPEGPLTSGQVLAPFRDLLAP